MLTYITRRLVLSVPTLLLIALIIFLLLELAPGDPMAQMPLTISAEVREQMRQALGLGEPAPIRFWNWLVQFFWIEPQVMIDNLFGTSLAEGKPRIISWQHHAPVMDIIWQRLPQTLWVVGSAYILGILIALPIGIYQAYRQYSVFDQAGTFVTLVGYSIPPFFTGPLLIVLFSVQLGWFPFVYDTTHQVSDWESFTFQVKQMILPVMVLSLQTTAQISRYMRASMLDNLDQDYVRTARAKGLSEARVVISHVLRNSMIPVVTVIALGMPAIFGGAIITEKVFGVNGIGAQLIGAIQANDLPTVQTLTFIFAVLIVFANIVADILYGVLDPRIRYD
ncbi:Dipeptide transport system permease protein DppB [Roseovarius albus]|uniref:Dipeptide transport system permease protein DppB n=1 Tax=Roseovarius albus TaxID=1247867 RepID=A0A1X6ZGF5_9RHOB|nr:ABC transporter permease [Roseovarius albus]SLN49079.1 Dipeptide transport system permease protein DppB [Roseovarius albus]